MTAMQECAGKSVWLCRGLWQGDCGSVYSREGGRVCAECFPLEALPGMHSVTPTIHSSIYKGISHLC